MPIATESKTLQDLRGVGPRVEKALNRLKIHTPRDLLFHLPNRYEDRTRCSDICNAQAGFPQLFEGEITAKKIIPGRRTQAILIIEDMSGAALIRLFHFSHAYLTTLSRSYRVRIFGEPRFSQGKIEFIHPEISVFKKDPPPLEDRLTPIYPTADGITQPRIRNVIQQALDLGPSAYELNELLGGTFAENRPSLWEALSELHQPCKYQPAQEYIERLAFEELVAHRLLLLTRRDNYIRFTAPLLNNQQTNSLQRELISLLPFQLTQAQKNVLADIQSDLQSTHPMLRLLQGDVGSGKTLVAALSAVTLLANGYQVALMAPTELLSRQHARQFHDWFLPLGISVGWLSGSLKTAPKRTILKQLKSGICQCIIGTHALFQDEVEFHNLGLVIIDEQHRFGVAQRLLLREKGNLSTPHQLIMTATPIPRTLAMTQFADLDVSIINELPPGRTPVDTRLVSRAKADAIAKRLDHQIENAGQAYWVCTLIEDDDELYPAEAAETRARKLKELLPHRRIGLVHSRLKVDDKIQTMTQFASGALDILVATTVIEVGVDVPNANIMVIENPERLGLSQLHQLRGRVGRGTRISYCILLYGDALSQNANERLKLLKQTNDGFILAEADLKLRGPGDVVGTRQTGDLSFRVADLRIHFDLLDEVAKVAERIRLQQPELRESLVARWISKEGHFVNV